jgi:hypothetical protein
MSGFPGFAAGGSDPSANRTKPALGRLVDPLLGSTTSEPSATAAAASNISNSATAKVFFMLVVLLGGVFPGDSVLVEGKYP